MLTAGPRPSRFSQFRPGRLASFSVGAAVLAAILLHAAFVALLLHARPARLTPAAAPTPRMAAVEMVQDNAPTTSDQTTLGGTAPRQAPPPVAPPPRQASGGGGPALPAGAGASPPPAPKAAPKPGQSARPEQAQPATPAPPDTAAGAEIRLSDSGDTGQGAAGGTAIADAVPDPKAHNRKPAYPTLAVLRHEQGRVDMVVHVAADGSAVSVVVANSSGSVSLDAAATNAVRHWTFTPAVGQNGAMATDVPVSLNFVLR